MAGYKLWFRKMNVVILCLVDSQERNQNDELGNSLNLSSVTQRKFKLEW